MPRPAATAPNGGGIVDAVYNAAVLTLPTTGTDGLATQHIAINTAPTVTGVSSSTAAGTYGAGTAITITVTFSTSVVVTGTPQLTLNDGGVADYDAGESSSTALTFDYTVAAGQNTADLDYVPSGALTLNNGGIDDTAGNPAVLTLPTVGTDGLAKQNIVINTAPTVTWVFPAIGTGTYGTGTAIPITVTFSGAVTVTGTPQLTLNDGGVADYDAGESSTTELTFDYTVAAGQNTADLDYASTAALRPTEAASRTRRATRPS